MKALQLKSGDTLLDMCCGLGRHVISLASKKIRCTGIDLAKKLIDEARSKCKEAEIKASFKVGDVRHITYRNKFSAVINISTSFGYYRDERKNEEVLKRAYAALKPGSRFLLHTDNHAWWCARTLKHKTWRGRVAWNWWVLEESTFDLLTDRVTTRALYLHKGKVYEVEWDYKIYSTAELVERLSAVGFSEMAVYGDFRRVSPDPDTHRICVVGRKPK